AAGVCVGTLSSIVLLATSFPDRDADREGGRRTLVVVVGPAAASYAYAALVAAFGAALAVSVALGALPPACAAALGALPLAASAARRLWRAGADAAALVPAMRRTVAFARLAGALVTAGLLV
ncbi:MAG: prenyltransferase, partial [Thaumarchaeota archaeon S13]